MKQKQEENSSSTSNIPSAITSSNANVSAMSNSGTIEIKSEKFDNLQDAKENTKDSESIKIKKEDTSSKEPAKPQDKSRPISSTPVPGTPW